MSRLFGFLRSAGKQPRTVTATHAVTSELQSEQFRVTVHLNENQHAEVWLYPLVEREPVFADGRLMFLGTLPDAWQRAEEARPLGLFLDYPQPPHGN